MTIIDLVVVGFLGYLFMNNQKAAATGTASKNKSSSVRDSLAKLPIVGGMFAKSAVNPLVEKVQIWAELMAKVKDEETKKQLNSLFPSLNREV